jgi:hypothetical protein
VYAATLEDSMTADVDPVLTEALDRLGGMMATDARDWGLSPRDAWTYGLFCGWDCEDDHEHDWVCGHGDEAMKEIARKHGWNDDDVARLRQYREAVRSIQEAPRG